MSVGTGGALAIGGGLALAGIGGSIIAGGMQAGAAQDASNAQYALGLQSLQQQQEQFDKQLKFATEARDQQKDARNQAVGLAGMSAQELAQFGTNISLQNNALMMQMQALQRDQSMLDAVDPAIKESGKQALELLQGKQSAAMGPVLEQRSRSRAQLEQTLADRLGPDYAQSSAGAAALRQFDNDTTTQANAIQQQTLGQLLGVAQSTSQSLNPVNNVSNAFSSLGSLNAYGLNAAQNAVGRQVNAFTGNPVNQQLQFNPVNYGPAMTAAGNSTIGSQMQAQAIGGAFNSLGGLGGQLLGYGFSQSNKPYNPFSNSGFAYPEATG